MYHMIANESGINHNNLIIIESHHFLFLFFFLLGYKKMMAILSEIQHVHICDVLEQL